jgi:hypothetical protein
MSSNQCDLRLYISSLKSYPHLLFYKTQHMSMSYSYTQYFNHNKIYNLLASIIVKEIEQRKTVCNPTRHAGSPSQHGSHSYMQVGCGHDGHLLRPSLHLSLVVDLVVEEPNAWKSEIEKTHSYHTGIKWCLYQTPRVHQSTERIYTYPALTKKENCKCQIT